MIPPFSRRKVGFGLKTLVKDSNVAQIEDPSAIWGAADHLPRRNLLTYTEDFSNAAWSKVYGGSATVPTVTSGFTDPDGGSTAWRVQAARTGTTSSDFSLIQYSLGRTDTCVGKIWLKSNTASSQNVHYRMMVGGSYVTVTTTWQQFSISEVGTYFTVGTRGGVVSDLTVDILIWHPQVILPSVIDQSYQRITDWVTEQYAWAAAAKNVPWLRRNYGVVTDDLTSATYTKSGATAPSATVLQCSAGAAVHNVLHATGPVTPVIGQTYYLSCKAKQETHPYIQLSSWNGMSTTAYANFDLSNGSIGTNSNCTPAITGPDADGFYTLSIAVSSVGTSASGFRASIQQSASDTRLLSWTAAGTETVNLKNIQISAGPCDYQAVGTSWAATYTALAQAAGYPISMYSDAAGSVATYGPDDPVRVMLDGSDGYALGPELVTNGDFSNGTTGWTDASTAPATFTSSGGTGVLARTSSGTARMRVSFSTVTGRSYLVSFTVTGYTLAASGFHVGTTAGGTDVLSDQTINNGTFRYIVRAASSTTWLNFYGPAYTHTHVYDNVSAKEIPGYHATAPSDAARPTLRLDGNGKWNLERDLVSNNLPVTWPTVLSDAQLGPDLVTNGGFDNDTWWSKGGTIAISSGTANFSATPSGSGFNRASLLTSGKTYKIEYEITSLASGGFRPYLGATYGATRITTGKFSETVTCGSTDQTFAVLSTAAGTTGSVDNVSVREVTGTNVIYTASGDYTTKDSDLFLSGATNYTTPKYDYGRIVLKAPSALDAKIIKYLDQKRGRTYQLGPELITALNFASGWTDVNVSSTPSTTSFVTSNTGGKYKDIGLVTGKTYLVTSEITKSNASASITINNSGGSSTPVVLNFGSSNTPGQLSATFVASSASVYFRVSLADTVVVNSLSVREVIIT